MGRPLPPGLPTGGLLRGGVGQTPRDTWDTTGYGQQAGRTHPAGMLSCNDIIVSLLTKPSFQSLKLGICVKLLDGAIHVLIGDGLAIFYHLVAAGNLMTIENLLEINTW